MSTIFKESDVITGKTKQEILDIMGSNKNSLYSSNLIDEDNDLFYVSIILDDINSELIDYYYDELHCNGIAPDDIKSKLNVYYYDYSYYAIWK